MNDDDSAMRVVVFTGGAVLEDDCVDFIAALDDCPEISVCAVFCEARSNGLPGVMRDLWSRRRWLAPLLIAQRALRRLCRIVFSPAAEIRRWRCKARLDDRLRVVGSLHAHAVLKQVAGLEPDLGVVYGGPILKPALFEIPKHGTLGIHHGLLPRYRGKKTTFWAIMNGEDSVGVAIQRIGAKLDGGDIVRDARLPVGRMPPCVINRRLHRAGLRLYTEAILSVRRGTATYKAQPAGGGTLYRDPRMLDIARFWIRYASRLAGRPVTHRDSTR